MALAYGDMLGSVEAWVDTQTIETADDTPTEATENMPDLEPIPEKKSNGNRDTKARKEPSDRSRSTSSRRSQRGKPRTPRKPVSQKSSTARRSSAPVVDESKPDEITEAPKDDATSNAEAKSEKSASTTTTKTASRRTQASTRDPQDRPFKHTLLVKLRTVEGEAERRKKIEEEKKNADKADEADDGDEEVEESEAEPKPQFPTRLWKPRYDYAANPPKSVVNAQNAHRERRVQEKGPSVSNSQRPTFKLPAKESPWAPAALPSSAKDLSEVPKMQEEELEKLTEKLGKPLPRGPDKREKFAEPLILESEDESKMLERLQKPPRRNLNPKHAIIEPLVLEEEDVDTIVKRLAAQRKPPPEPKDLPAPPKRKLESADAEKAVTSRLYNPKFFEERHEKWSSKHIQMADGFTPSEYKFYDEFHKISSPTAGRRGGAGNSPERQFT